MTVVLQTYNSRDEAPIGCAIENSALKYIINSHFLLIPESAKLTAVSDTIYTVHKRRTASNHPCLLFAQPPRATQALHPIQTLEANLFSATCLPALSHIIIPPRQGHEDPLRTCPIYRSTCSFRWFTPGLCIINSWSSWARTAFSKHGRILSARN